ncbi:hypothetical protein Poli38472_001041 [Pythium oligandrum]|uniref:Uncharacterized protein n=1 Tax=Pythium oligandrum TaxID=41045 RepID=A0A8K1CUG2_PYTOL|nr:hypothetical protein Poli38472_001041 [Pythium oligandrum]|eukprot:TMW68885.1 hypothetical protein Poli38472_001041 [Pythium oligandrum]
MNIFTRLVFGAALLAVAVQTSLTAAEQPAALEQRRAEIRNRLLQAKAAKVAAFEKREYDFYHRDDNKRKRV